MTSSDERVLIYREGGGSFNSCMKDTYLVPLSLIEKLPGDVRTAMKEVNTMHPEEAREANVYEKYCYIGLLLGEQTPDTARKYCDPNLRSFFDALEPLERLYNAFGKHKEGSKENMMFDVPPNVKIVEVHTRNKMGLCYVPGHNHL